MTKVKILTYLSIAFCVLVASGYVYYLHSKNERLEASIKQKQSEIDELNIRIINTQNAIDELSANVIEKENLSNEIEAIRTEIIKNANTTKNSVDKSLKDAGEFIQKRAKNEK